MSTRILHPPLEQIRIHNPYQHANIENFKGLQASNLRIFNWLNIVVKFLFFITISCNSIYHLVPLSLSHLCFLIQHYLVMIFEFVNSPALDTTKVQI